MNCEYIHGYPFYTFTSPDILTNKMCQSVQNLHYINVSNTGNSSMMGYNLDQDKNLIPFCDKELYDFLDSCLEPIYKKHFKFGPKHKIVDLWSTKASFGALSEYHLHVNSVFSGLFYLSDSKTSTSFLFEDRLVNYWDHIIKVEPQKLEYESSSVKGKVVIWPSMLKHKINVHREKEIRYSIAFNSFWDGCISSVPTAGLELDSISAMNIKNKWP